MYSQKFTAAAFHGAVICAGVLLAGCGSDRPQLAPVSGSVTQAGKPVAEAQVVLHPLEPQPVELPKPIAVTDESGRFHVSCLSQGDGALPGEYAVTVELRALRQAGEEMIRDGKHLLPARFADPATSGIMKEVLPGDNHWDPIAIPTH